MIRTAAGFVRYLIPFYQYECFGFRYPREAGFTWFIMDDYGNAVISNVGYAGE